MEGKSGHRYQWEGITDAPRTYTLSVMGPTRNQKMGYGGYLFTDIVGPTRRTGLYGTYAYHLKLNSDLKLSLGLNFGLLQFMIDASKITLREEGDAILTNGVQSVILPDAGFGFYLYHNKFFFGGSLPQLFKNRVKFFKEGLNPEGTLAWHYFVNGGYNFEVNDDFTLTPMVILKYVDPAPLQLDGSLKITYRDKIWLAGSYRTLDAIAVSIGYNLAENFTFGYAYDFTTTNLKNYTTGTHELMVGVRFYKPGNKSKSAASIE
ncbi:MAG: hypothetical protein Kow0079_04260 [Vicingaceae bacterium]